jgi:cytochrome c oxidase cbb3-type subunit 3
VDGKEETSNWNTRALLLRELDESHSAVRQREFLQKIAAADFATIRSDPEMLAFTRSVGKGLFGDNCAACHGRGGQGLVGLYPNLADDDWLWGGEMEKIQETLVQGRQGFMPAFRETFKLKPEQLDDVATYVLSLSGEAPTGAAVDRGRELFQGTGGGCYYCHGKDGKGVPSQGGANLTDKIWTVANVPAQASLDSRKAVVKEVISNGINRQMPGWEQRLTPAQIKLLSVYVHELGGGQ